MLLISSPVCLYAGVAELADALDLGSSGATREGSSPFARTIHTRGKARLTFAYDLA